MKSEFSTQPSGGSNRQHFSKGEEHVDGVGETPLFGRPAPHAESHAPVLSAARRAQFCPGALGMD